MFRALQCPLSEARQTAVAASGFRMNVEVEVFSAVVGLLVKTPLYWNPQRYSRKGRPKRTWRRTIEDELRNTGKEVKGIAGDCSAWKLFMDAVCSTASKRN